MKRLEQGDPMSWCYREPTIAEMLSDSMVRSLMKADGVDPCELEAMLRQIAAAQSRDGWKWLRAGRKSPDKVAHEYS
jgi:hypothetical protein